MDIKPTFDISGITVERFITIDPDGDGVDKDRYVARHPKLLHICVIKDTPEEALECYIREITKRGLEGFL